jgi:hypothetical protein
MLLDPVPRIWCLFARTTVTGVGSRVKLWNQSLLEHMVRVAPESRIHWLPMSSWSNRETIARAVSVVEMVVSISLSPPSPSRPSVMASFADDLGDLLSESLASSRALFSFRHSKMSWPLNLQCAQVLLLLVVGLSAVLSRRSPCCGFFPALAKYAAVVPPDSITRRCSSQRMRVSHWQWLRWLECP